ncbi:DUF1640 domain-containing protein [Methylobacterium sp. JK268]
MMALALDTLAILRKLRASGFSEDQAEAITGVLKDSRDAGLEALATKADLRETELRIESRFEATKADLREAELRIESRFEATKADLRETELRLEGRIEATKAEIIKWVLSAIGFQSIVIVGAIVALARAAH